MEVKRLKINEIKEYDKNPRIHTPEQVERLKESLRQFGFVNPVIVTRDMVLVAGHGRLQAARALGLEEVPAIIVDFDEDKARAYRIADNQLTILGDWDFEALTDELRAISNDELVTALGFENDELRALMDTVEDDTAESLNELMGDYFEDLGIPSSPKIPGREDDNPFDRYTDTDDHDDRNDHEEVTIEGQTKDLPDRRETAHNESNDVDKGEHIPDEQNAPGDASRPNTGNNDERFKMELSYSLVLQLGGDLDKANDILALFVDSVRKVVGEGRLLYVLNVPSKRDFRFDTRKYTVMAKLQRIPGFEDEESYIFPSIRVLKGGDHEERKR